MLQFAWFAKATSDHALPVLQLLQRRIEAGQQRGEKGFIIDGYPRTLAQAEMLLTAEPVQLAINLSLREDILVDKCLGRRLCSKCGRNFNVADLQYPAENGRPEVRLLCAPRPGKFTSTALKYWFPVRSTVLKY
jgi:adenylate kinase